ELTAPEPREPVPIRELSPNVPDGLADVVKKLMAKTPEGRYSACDEAVEALEPFVGDLAAIAAQPGGSRPGSHVSGSSGRMAGLSSRATGSGHRLPGLSPPIPPGSHLGTGLGGPPNPVGTPPPSRARPMPRPPRPHP